MGGTFDYLHSGHKLLLTQACFLTGAKMIIGVASDSLLAKKKNADLIQPWHLRSGTVRAFLERLRSRDALVLDIFELVDPAGKGATEADIDGVILTKEVEKGGHFINQKRKENGFSELPFAFVDLVFEQSAEGTAEGAANEGAPQNMDNKISSSKIREFLKKKHQATPVSTPSVIS